MSLNQPEFDHQDEPGQRRENQRNEQGHPDVLSDPNAPMPDVPETLPVDPTPPMPDREL